MLKKSVLKKNLTNRRLSIPSLVLILAFILSGLTYAKESSDAKFKQLAAPQNPIVIQIDDTKITLSEYHAVFNQEIRNRFYHSKVSEQEKSSFHLVVANKMIDRFLMLQEIAKRKISANTQEIEKQVEEKIKQMDLRYKDNPDWIEGKEQYRKDLSVSLSQKAQLEKLTQIIKNVAAPSEKDIYAYYQANPDKFMAPVQQRISVIIIGVPPSSNNQVWDKARNLAKEIKQKLDNGESFATLAELHSTDISAEMGGDMGSVHVGMLGDAAQKIIDQLQPGDVSDPVTLLEGIALLKLTHRVESKLNTFARVKPQAQRLLHEERAELAWKQFIFTLREAVNISINEKELEKLVK